MSPNITNTIDLDYKLLKAFNSGYNKVFDFYAGFLFPSNKTLTTALWDFGDGTYQTTEVVSGSVQETEFNTAVESIKNNASDFLPRWKFTDEDISRIPIPKFKTSHTYSSDGIYKVSVVLIDSEGIGYSGIPLEVNVSTKLPENNIPFFYNLTGGVQTINWASISQEYVLSNESSLFFTSREDVSWQELPYLTTINEDSTLSAINIKPDDRFAKLIAKSNTTNSIPIETEFVLLNVEGRADIDYIEWVFDDGTIHVDELKQSPVLKNSVNKNYSYNLLPSRLSYEPYVILYINRNNIKKKIKISSNEVVVQDRTNIGVSKALNTSRFEVSYPFNIFPLNTVSLPVETSFIVNVVPNLTFIIWNFDDGTIDVTPVSYDTSRTNVNQTVTIKHKYNSANFYDFVPECIFLYKNSDGSFTLERYISRYYLKYTNALMEPTLNYFKIPAISTSAYTKFNNIHVMPIYTQDGYADLYLRVEIGTSKEIFQYEKLIWQVNNTRIIQDKNTAEVFGKIVVPFFPTNQTVNITVDFYGYSENSTENSNQILKYLTFSYNTFINEINKQELINKAYLAKKLASSPPRQIDIINPLSGSPEDIPVLDLIEFTEDVVAPQFPQLTGVNYVFDNLFIATAPWSNFLNREMPSTVSNPTRSFATEREVGFFKPSKSTNIIVEPGQFTFSVNFDKLSFDKPYYFPDPYRYGSDTPALTYNIDINSFKKRNNFFIARDEPNTTEQLITFYGYSSETSNTKDSGLSYIFDTGYIEDLKTDIYNNTYGLFKTIGNFNEPVGTPVYEYKKSIIFNGYKFFDSYFGGGGSFNYSLTGGDGLETFRTGLTANCGTFSSAGATVNTKFGAFNGYSFRSMTHPIDINYILLDPKPILYRDATVFMQTDTVFNNSVYYSLSYGGDDGFLTNSRYLSGNDIEELDGCLFISNIPDENIGNYTTGVQLSGIENESRTTKFYNVTSNYVSKRERDNYPGVIYIKDSNGNTNKLVDRLDYLKDKYSLAEYTSLSSGVQSFDLAQNTLFIQTSSYLFIEKINYDGEAFNIPNTAKNVINYNLTPFNCISNRFKVKDEIYFATLSSIYQPTSSLSIFPQIYKYSITTQTLIKIYPNNNTFISDFSIDITESDYIEAETLKITYNLEHNTFNLSWLLKDLNKSPYLISTSFKLYDEVNITSIDGFKFTKYNNTIQFNSNNTNVYSTFAPIISSSTPQLSNFIIIL